MDHQDQLQEAPRSSTVSPRPPDSLPLSPWSCQLTTVQASVQAELEAVSKRGAILQAGAILQSEFPSISLIIPNSSVLRFTVWRNSLISNAIW